MIAGYNAGKYSATSGTRQTQVSQHARDRPTRYHILILSLWEADSGRGDAPVRWRYSLQDPHTAERNGFTTLAELDAFLEQRMAQWVGNEDEQSS